MLTCKPDDISVTLVAMIFLPVWATRIALSSDLFRRSTSPFALGHKGIVLLCLIPSSSRNSSISWLTKFDPLFVRRDSITGEILLKALDSGTARCVPYYIHLYPSTVTVTRRLSPVGSGSITSIARSLHGLEGMVVVLTSGVVVTGVTA